ncbi:TetR/AcrR family transcriptional regulator [Phytobacter diazotrophicus]|jgi:AcrR family transcriptional regulator|uniref:TetR/AcrR family transcriptional regulator n=2 Tax=Enterobacteriaceae TaxID=543 RepID=A0ABW1Q6P2_9ENTR|nr:MULTISPECIES: TetR/AcrR family transcriptional regulator [Phytobacter]MBS6739855.1 TetR/AcrR family transcriptional regulator [Enterobacteriaceae bacterium]PTA89507.1 TetR/AcrR family transcriptional regulator [Kluyvera sp. Nf5]PXW57661.1 TetR family transcriptional regulator [Grimontella sp. AG753]QIH66239.1 TetR/AcrR family transcriptional regulator [Enterobacteriaceae bacterium A-F18]SLJ99905.1 transcriptional regulator, TetR family [Enterobacter sp. NFR05]
MRVKSETKRQTILDVATKAFIELGFNNTSMSEIASRVGGSKSTLYNYFSSKEEIFSAVMETSAKREIADAFESLDFKQDIEITLNKFGRQYLASIMRGNILAIWRMAVSESERSDIGQRFYTQGPQRGWKLLSDYLGKKIEEGVLRKSDSGVCAMHLKGLIEAELYLSVVLGVEAAPDSKKIEEVTARAVTVFLLAYRA